jgi:hypothetical protein
MKVNELAIELSKESVHNQCFNKIHGLSYFTKLNDVLHAQTKMEAPSCCNTIQDRTR